VVSPVTLSSSTISLHLPHLFIIPSQVCEILESDSQGGQSFGAQIDETTDGMSELGGAIRRAVRLTRGAERKGEFFRMILAIVVFSLVIGAWVCLWVPAAPVF
jgi:hypothetical protein